MKFSQRKGFKAVSEIIQIDGMSGDLRNSLWNAFAIHIWDAYGFRSENIISSPSYVARFCRLYWKNYLKKPLDGIPDICSWAYGQIREMFFECLWYEVYDFIEWVLNNYGTEGLIINVNSVLEKEISAYRFGGGVITDITDEQEIQMLENELADDDFPGVRAHLQTALEMLSRRENPDFRNSIKESISAVESIAIIITEKPKATLSDAIKELEKSGKLHKALKDGFSKLYAYTSDEEGVRHAMMDEPDLSIADAKYFLLSCINIATIPSDAIL